MSLSVRILKKIVRNEAMALDPPEIYGWRVYLLACSVCQILNGPGPDSKYDSMLIMNVLMAGMLRRHVFRVGFVRHWRCHRPSAIY